MIELLEYENHLKRALINDFENDYWAAIKNTIDKYDLSTENFLNLLRAFKQDVIKSRYENYTELLDYCSRSANPVGRTILELNGINDETALKFSDSICTALQLTNFYQDISIDLKKNRVYLPQDELKEFGISDVHFNGEAVNENLREFLKFQVERTEALFLNGRKLIQYLSGKLKYQIMWTILGGETILAKIRKIDYDTPNFRPTLSKFDYIRLMIKSVFIKK